MNVVGLAELSDKMGSALHWWFGAAILSLPLVWAAIRVGGQAGRWLTVCLAGGLTILLLFAAVREAFLDGDFSVAIQQEMRNRWIAHRITSACLPLVLVGITLGLRRRGGRKPNA